MTEANIYSFAETTFSKDLARLIDTLYSNKYTMQILCADKATVGFIDTLLWTYSQLSFLPHGTENDPYPEMQPVFITTNINNNPRGSKVLILIGVDVRVPSEKALIYEKIMVICKDSIDSPLLQMMNELKIPVYQVVKNVKTDKWEKTLV